MNSNPYQLSRLHLLPPRPQSDCTLREPQSNPPSGLAAVPSMMLAPILGTPPAPIPHWHPPASPHMPRSPRCPGGGMLLAPSSLPRPPPPGRSLGSPCRLLGLHREAQRCYCSHGDLRRPFAARDWALPLNTSRSTRFTAFQRGCADAISGTLVRSHLLPRIRLEKADPSFTS